MILAIDIGNTNLVLGGFDGEDLTFVSRIATDPSKTEDEYASKIRSVLTLHGVENTQIEGVIISSVVPQLNGVMQKATEMLYGMKPIMVAPGIKTGIQIICDNPSTVGADLICGCVAAHVCYGSPSLVIDMGTATKIMVVDQGGAFVGASIGPGVGISLQALSGGTAQLPHISLDAPKSVIGKNTADCMRSGVIFGNAAMLDGMIDRFWEELGEEVPVIATGGLSATIVPYCRHEITLDATLVLKGLYILYQKNKGEN